MVDNTKVKTVKLTETQKAFLKLNPHLLPIENLSNFNSVIVRDIDLYNEKLDSFFHYVLTGNGAIISLENYFSKMF